MDNQANDENIFDIKGYRYNVGTVIINDAGQVFFAKRKGQNSWQFPQGGLNVGESCETAMFRELQEETGLVQSDVSILGCTQRWHNYRLPTEYRRCKMPGRIQCIGQKQKWFLLRLQSDESKINLNATNKPEFDNWCWMDYWLPAKKVVYFKRGVYWAMLEDLTKFYDRTLPEKPVQKTYNRRRQNFYKPS